MGMGVWDPNVREHIILHKRLIDTIKVEVSRPASGSEQESQIELIEADGFPKRNWEADLRSMLVLADYAATSWRADIKLESPPRNDSEKTLQEIMELIRIAKTERPSLIKEIAEQDMNILNYFLHLLMINRQSHPETYHVLKISARISEITSSYLKNKFNRSRPAQLYPQLLPEMNISAHPSYPSGHAMIAYMFAHCMSDVVPKMNSALLALAAQIGRNREIAGFHFRSDTEAGVEAARQASTLLRELPSYTKAVEAAKAEWRS